MLGLENVGQYMQAKQAQKMPDWTEIELDNEGKLVQEEMTRKFQVDPFELSQSFHWDNSDPFQSSSYRCVVLKPCWLSRQIDSTRLHRHMESPRKSGLTPSE